MGSQQQKRRTRNYFYHEQQEISHLINPTNSTTQSLPPTAMDTTSWLYLFPFSLLLSSAFWFFLFSTRTTKPTTGSGNGRLLPPGFPSVPIIGNLLTLRTPIVDLSLSLRRLRRLYGPIVNYRFGTFPSIFVLDRHLAHHALVHDGAAFSDRPPVGTAAAVYTSNGCIVSSANGPLWGLLRRNLVSGLLHPSRVRSFSGERRWVLARLVGDIRERAGKSGDGVVVIAEAFRHAIFRLLVVMCFGERLDDGTASDIEGVQRDLLMMMWKLNVFDLMPVSKLFLWPRWRTYLSIRGRQERIMIPLIEARRNVKQKQEQSSHNPKTLVCYVDSLVDLELPEEGGRKLTDDKIVSLCSELFSGGTDTTTTTLEWTMANLVKNPGIQQKLLNEINAVVPLGDEIHDDDLQKMPYLKAVILEGLRRHPPLHILLPHFMPREARLGDYTIPKGFRINFAVGEMGWDEEVWEEPFEFRPERFLEGGEGAAVDITGSRGIRMAPFGAGRRICPGLGLAMLHLQYYVACLVREFEWQVVEGEGVDLSEKLEFTFVMKNSLRARVVPRESAAGGLSTGSS